MDDLYWEFTEPFEGENVLPKLEKELGVTFPGEYKKCATENNGGRPSKDGLFSEALGTVWPVGWLVRVDEGKGNILGMRHHLQEVYHLL